MNFGEREGKAKAKHRGRVLEKVYYVFFFFNNILLMWKIVEVSKGSVLYVYIDKLYDLLVNLETQNQKVHKNFSYNVIVTTPIIFIAQLIFLKKL